VVKRTSGQSGDKLEAARRVISKVVDTVAESQALSYALVMVLASTPREALSSDEIDALCQVAYELQQRLAAAVELFEEFEIGPDP
jgi:hypothetical protein